MPRHELMRDSKYSAKQMFDMAADVASYHEFLPLVYESLIYGEQEETKGVLTFKGQLSVRQKKLRIDESFISDVIANSNELTIVSTSSSGPVKRLTNAWKFVDLPGGGSQSKMVLDYEISSFAMRLVMRASYDLVMTKLTEAFEKRADQLYG